MRRKIANWLVCIARRLYPHGEYELVEKYLPRKLCIGYHIAKSDVRKLRNKHPEYSSHRKGLDALIKDTKDVILGNIVAGIKHGGLVEYKVKKTFWTADITGALNVYVPQELADGSKEDNDTTEESA